MERKYTAKAIFKLETPSSGSSFQMSQEVGAIAAMAGIGGFRADSTDILLERMLNKEFVLIATKELSLEKEVSDTESEVTVSDSTSDTAEVEQSASVVVENPSIASTDNTNSPRDNSGSKKLGTFEKKVCKEYMQLLEKDGLNFAENYLRSKRRYLRRGFHPKNYIQLGE